MGVEYSILGVAGFLRTGNRDFGKAGYLRAAAAWARDDVKDAADLVGKTYIVTGANAGLGRATTAALARRGATVHMVCRNLERATAARDDIVATSKNDKVHVHIVDVSDRAAVRTFATDFLATDTPLDGLINNAGVLLPEQAFTRDGLDATFATMVMQTYMLTGMLVPALAKSRHKPARVVDVSSGGQYTVRARVDDMNCRTRKYDGTRHYAQVKRAQIMLSAAAAARLSTAGIVVNSMHPGWVDTPGVQTSIPDFAESHRDDLRTPDQGIDTILWLATSHEGGTYTGQFFFDRAIAPTDFRWAGTAASDEERAALWAVAQASTGYTWLDAASIAMITAAAGAGALASTPLGIGPTTIPPPAAGGSGSAAPATATLS